MEQKKKYFIPKLEVMLLNTADLMRAGDSSDTPTPPGAPARRTEVF